MHRLACVNTPELSLQLLLVEHPEWRDKPTVVVSEDKPLGRIVSANRPAKREGIEVGMRFAAALAICSVLQAGVVQDEVLEAGVRRILNILKRFSPEVEPCTFDAGTFWLNASGLEPMFTSIEHWAHQLVETFGAEGLFVSVVVGFSRFGTYSCSKRRPQIQLFSTAEEEYACAYNSPISILPLLPTTYQRLSYLGMRTVGAFAALSEGNVRRRFGKEPATVHRFVTGKSELPLQPIDPESPILYRRSLQTPERDQERIRLRIEELLSQADHDVSTAMLFYQLEITLRTEEGKEIRTTIRPAKPTRAVALLMKLIALRLQHIAIGGPVEHISLLVQTVKRGRSQEELFGDLRTRDSKAAAHAFALLRAEFGNDTVQRVELCDEHLPEAQYRLVPLYVLPPLQNKSGHGETVSPPARIRLTLVRRTLISPVSATSVIRRSGHQGSRSNHGHERFQPTLSQEPIRGPFVITSSWSRIDREYYFSRTGSGRLWWIFYDRISDRWMVQGWVD